MTLLLAFLLGTVFLGLVTTNLSRVTYLMLLGGSCFVTVVWYGMQRFWT